MIGSRSHLLSARTASESFKKTILLLFWLALGVYANAQSTTTISGIVYDPRTTADALPLPKVLVYATTAPVAPLEAGVQCLTYSAPSGVVGYTYTAADGTFTLNNVPQNTSYTLVIQAGKWRRQFSETVGTAPLAGLNLHMPSDHTQGDIPLIAISTGNADGLECVFRNMGIADSEFTDDTGATNPGGRIHLYSGLGIGGAVISTSTPVDTAFTENTATLNNYDMVMFPCQGTAFAEPGSALSNLVGYANAGGRVFATHYSYAWLDPGQPYDSQFPPVADWNHALALPLVDPGIATVNTGFSDGATLAQWLQNIGADYQNTPGQVQIGALRNDLQDAIAPTQVWLTDNDATLNNPIMQISFNAPVGAPAANQCGRVMYNEYHVIDATSNNGLIYPAECPASPTMDAQQQVLEYALFDLSSFVQPVIVPTVSITFAPSPLSVKQGDTADQVTVDVTNTSANTEIDSSAVLTFVLPPLMTASAISDAGGGWSCAASTLKCTRKTTLPSNASDSVTLTLSVGSYPPGGLANATGLLTATVSSPEFSSNVSASDKVVFQQQPAITWPTPAPIAYGTPLSAIQLDASSQLPGSFAYSPLAGTVLPGGQQILQTTFTPADTADYIPATASVTLTVFPAPVPLAITASANPAFVSNAVTFTAHLTSVAASPTGIVTFYDGTTQLGSAPVSAGAATLTVTSLQTGIHSIAATYSGDGNYQPANSASLSETIEDFTLALTGAASATVYPGTAATYPMTITPVGGATLPAAISLSVTGLPVGTTASFAPGAVAANAATTPITLRLTPTGLTLARPMRKPFNGSLLPVVLGLILFPFSRRLRRRWSCSRKASLVIIAAAGLAMGLLGCQVTYTPHTADVTITAASGPLSHTTIVSFTVE